MSRVTLLDAYTEDCVAHAGAEALGLRCKLTLFLSNCWLKGALEDLDGRGALQGH